MAIPISVLGGRIAHITRSRGLQRAFDLVSTQTPCAASWSKPSRRYLTYFATSRRTELQNDGRKPIHTSASLDALSLRPTARLQAQQSSASPSSSASNGSPHKISNLANGLSDEPIVLDEGDARQVDWARSFHGLSAEPFSKEAADILLQPLAPEDIEIKPDGIIYLPEIKYRRILNKAFGPGGWGMAPRGETIVTGKSVTREYALVAHGRLVSIARGEQDYFSPEGISTAAEGCKSNALMRCCKDLGVASELWDPRFIRKFMAANAREVFVEHVPTKKRRKLWVRKGEDVKYPYKETKG